MSDTSAPYRAQYAFELFGDTTDNCQRAAIAFEEAGIAYSARKILLRRGEHLAAEHMARNADGKVPTLLVRSDDGQVRYISQSNAIMLFADSLAPGRLLPVDPLARAAAMETYAYLVTEVATLRGVARQLRLAEARDAAAGVERWAADRFCEAERYLGEAGYFAGDAFGLPDIVAVTLAHDLQHLIPWEDRDRLLQWRAAVSERPAVAKGMRAFA